MRVLVTETDQHGSDAVIADLRRAGHEVVRCVGEDDASFPCRALTERSCPVDDGVDVVVTKRGLPYPRRTAREDGVVCALRRSVPLVVTGTSVGNPFEEWTTVEAGEDVVGACERAAAAPLREHSAVAAAEVARLSAAVGEGEGDTSGAVVHRRDGRITVTLSLPSSVADDEAHRIAVRVAAVLRAFDPHATDLDVVRA